MDAKQTEKERKQQIKRLLAKSLPQERVQILAAMKDRSLREAVLRLGWENDIIRRAGILTDADVKRSASLLSGGLR